MKHLADFIKEKRKAEKLTQAQFADRAGVGAYGYTEIRAGKRKF